MIFHCYVSSPEGKSCALIPPRRYPYQSINTTYVTLLLKRLPCSGPSCRPSLQNSSRNQCALLVLTVFRHVSCTINISRHLHLQWKSLKLLKLHTIHTKLALGVDGKGTPALIGCPDVAAQSDAFHDKAWHLWIPWKNLWESYSRYSRPFSDGETAGVDADVTWFHFSYYVRFYMFFLSYQFWNFSVPHPKSVTQLEVGVSHRRHQQTLNWTLNVSMCLWHLDADQLKLRRLRATASDLIWGETK